MSASRASSPALVGLACFGLVLYAIAERSVTAVHPEDFQEKLEAVSLMQRAETAILAAKRERDILIDPRNDPQACGVIGPQFTLITTDRGAQAAKELAAHPNFAAAVTQLMLHAEVARGDLVAVGMTGSLPGLNIAVLSACKAIGAEPIVITSVGSSMFGANDPELTWLDMETVLVAERIFPYLSRAASLGGGDDMGRGLSPAGRQLILEAIERNHVRLLDPDSLAEAVRQRIALFDSVAAAQDRRIKLYVNVGGGMASLGGAQNAQLIPAGLTRRLDASGYPSRGVIHVLAERGLPVLHLLEIEHLAQELGVGGDSATVPPGTGPLFVKYRYNLWVVGTSALLLLVASLVTLRLDVRQRLLGLPHPERVSES